MAPPVELVDLLEPVDSLLTLRLLGLESRRFRERFARPSRGGRFDGRWRRAGPGDRRDWGRFRGGFGGLEGRVNNRRVALEHALDGLAQVLQQVPAVRDLRGMVSVLRRGPEIGRGA